MSISYRVYFLFSEKGTNEIDTYCTTRSQHDALPIFATTRRFFADGKLSKRRWREALTEISAEFQQYASVYRDRGWKEVYGASGTVKAVGDIASKMKLSRGQISDQAIDQICERLPGFDRIDAIILPGLAADRPSLSVGGLVGLEATSGSEGGVRGNGGCVRGKHGG